MIPVRLSADFETDSLTLDLPSLSTLTAEAFPDEERSEDDLDLLLDNFVSAFTAFSAYIISSSSLLAYPI